MLSKAQKQKYLQSQGTRCPDCGDKDITGYHIEVDKGTATQELQCNNCGNFWRDVYQLIDVLDG